MDQDPIDPLENASAVPPTGEEHSFLHSEEWIRLAALAAGMVTWEWLPKENRFRTSENFADLYCLSSLPEVDAGFPFVVADDRESHASKVRTVAAIGGSYTSEFRIQRPDDGRIVWIEERGQAELDKAGHVVRVAGIAMDITARKKTETERDLLLAEAEAAHATADLERRRLQAVLEQLPLGVHVAEAPGGQLLLGNAAVRSICGDAPASASVSDYSNDYAGYHPPGHVHAGLPLASSEWPLARTLATGLPVSGQLVEIRRSDGTRRLASISAVPVRNGLNMMVGAVAISEDVTDRTRGEEALRISEERLKMIFESATDFAIIATDVEGRVTAWNSGACRIFGHTETEASGLPAHFIFTPEDRAAGVPEKEMAGAREEGRAIDERWHLRKSGERFWLSGVMAPLMSGDGLVGYVKVARDLTDQRRAESALRDSESRFRTLADAVPQLVWTNGQCGRPNYFNRRWHEYTGLTKEESEGLGWEAVVHPDDERKSKRRWLEALSAGQAFETEYRLRGRDGHYRWFIGRNEPWRDADGNLVAWFGTATDVEVLKTAEQEVRRSEERLRTALESAEMAAWDWDVGRDEVTWNDRHFLILGLTPHAGPISPAYFTRFVHPDDRESVEALLGQSVDLGKNFKAEFRILRADTGETRWMSGYGRAVERCGTRTLRMTGVMFDVTDYKSITEELRRAQCELEQRVRDRTNELSQAVAHLEVESSSRKRLEEERHRLLERLVASQEDERARISRELHDNLSQHMVSVKMGLERLGNGTAHDGRDTKAVELKELSERVDALISAAHRQAWELRPSELDHLGLEAALQNYTSIWSERSGLPVEWESSRWDDLRLPSNAEIALYRVAQEALTNVARHAEANNVWVRMVYQDNVARVTVQDDGNGFEAEAGKGRLGIVGMRERMSLIGGELEIDSGETKGTTVTAYLPLE